MLCCVASRSTQSIVHLVSGLCAEWCLHVRSPFFPVTKTRNQSEQRERERQCNFPKSVQTLSRTRLLLSLSFRSIHGRWTCIGFPSITLLRIPATIPSRVAGKIHSCKLRKHTAAKTDPSSSSSSSSRRPMKNRTKLSIHRSRSGSQSCSGYPVVRVACYQTACWCRLVGRVGRVTGRNLSLSSSAKCGGLQKYARLCVRKIKEGKNTTTKNRKENNTHSCGKWLCASAAFPVLLFFHTQPATW